jgi:hypothetical protein
VNTRVATIAKTAVTAGALAVSLIGFGGFAGIAAADPEACWGGIGLGSDHQPFTVGSAANAGCTTSHDTSDTSTTDIQEAGSYPAGGSYPGHDFTWAPTPQFTAG